MEERVIRSETEVYRWDGPKAAMSLQGTRLGTLVLTDRHLLFLSTGGNDLGGRLAPAVLGGAVGGEPAAVSSGSLDLGVLANPGSFAVPVHHVDEARAACRWDRTTYLSLRLRDGDEAPFEVALMRKTGMPSAKGWALSLDAARATARR
jgi:hypothetical protein